MSRSQRLVCVLLAGLLLLRPSLAADTDRTTLNFVNADVEAVVKAIALITGKNFVVDPRIKGTITLFSGSPIPREMAYAALLSALRLQGFAAVETEGMVRIVPEPDAKTHPAPVGKAAAARGGALVTQVFPIVHESAAQLYHVVRPLVTANNAVTVYPNSNALVVSDYADNVRRIERILATIDVPTSDDPVLIPLRHALAADVASLLSRSLADTGAAAAGAATDSSQRVSVQADTRTNTLIVRARPSRLLRIRALVAELDQQGSGGASINVIYLKNAEATKVAQTLRGMLNGAEQGIQASAPGTAPGSAGAAPLAALTASESLGKGLNVQADAAANALIVTAPSGMFENIRRVVEMLDRRRAQVFVEALIAEVSSERASEFGIQWQNLTGAGQPGTRLFGGTNFGSSTLGQNITSVAQNPQNVGAGLNIGIVRGTINLPGTNTAILNLGALATFLETSTRTNILSTPTLLTLDNEEAKIVIGQNVPFITGQYATTGQNVTASPFQTFERRDVGLTLRIRPQISEGGTVRVQIFQEVSSVAETTTSGPVTNKRSIESTVLIDDGGIIALGGLIEDSYTIGRDKVPLLGDLPLIGSLFRYDTRKRTKTNLLVFLRPQILRDAESYRGLTGERYDYILGEQRRSGEPSAADARAPALPARRP